MNGIVHPKHGKRVFFNVDEFYLLKKRNNWVVAVFAAVITVVQMLNFALGIPLRFVLTVEGIIFLVLVPMAIAANLPKLEKRLTPYMKYFNMAVIGVFMYMIIDIDPHMINVMTMYFYVAIMGIYQDRHINWMTTLITLTILCYYFFTQGEVIFYSTNVNDLLYYIVTFCFVSISNIMQAKFNNNLQMENRNKTQKVLEAKQAMEQMLSRMTESVQSIREYQTNLNTAVDTTNQRSVEIVSSIENIMQSFEVQNQNSVSYCRQMNLIHEKVEAMNSELMSAREAGAAIPQLQEFDSLMAELKDMLQEAKEEAENTANITEANTSSLKDVLGLVSVQQQEITDLSEGFNKLEKQMSRMNRKNQY
ncbi:hypothetical protein M3231_22415 [Neobacillus mesonae]|nr:hypothetical protein [Neobacillus mesonae]